MLCYGKDAVFVGVEVGGGVVLQGDFLHDVVVAANTSFVIGSGVHGCVAIFVCEFLGSFISVEHCGFVIFFLFVVVGILFEV